MSSFEILTFVFGLLSVWFTVKQNIWCWPTGLIMVVLYLVVCWQQRLYSDMGLQVVYIVLQLYGWHHWLHGGMNDTTLPVSRISRTVAILWSAAGAVATAILGYLMSKHTNADVPYWDAGTTVFSLVAQWLMARKVWESWLVWLSVDVIYIGVFIYKDMNLMAVLYVIFMALCCKGLLEWRKTIPVQPAA